MRCQGCYLHKGESVDQPRQDKGPKDPRGKCSMHRAPSRGCRVCPPSSATMHLKYHSSYIHGSGHARNFEFIVEPKLPARLLDVSVRIIHKNCTHFYFNAEIVNAGTPDHVRCYNYSICSHAVSQQPGIIIALTQGEESRCLPQFSALALPDIAETFSDT